jgi:hypothetical protein
VRALQYNCNDRITNPVLEYSNTWDNSRVLRVLVPVPLILVFILSKGGRTEEGQPPSCSFVFEGKVEGLGHTDINWLSNFDVERKVIRTSSRFAFDTVEPLTHDIFYTNVVLHFGLNHPKKVLQLTRIDSSRFLHGPRVIVKNV